MLRQHMLGNLLIDSEGEQEQVVKNFLKDAESLVESGAQLDTRISEIIQG
jgi:hypothetical protein